MTSPPSAPQPTSLPPLRRTEWALQVDDQRLREKDVLALLRNLAEQSIRYVYDNGDQPALDRQQTLLLRPLAGRIPWSRKDRKYAASAIRRPVHLSDPPKDPGSNEVMLLTFASTRPRGWLSRKLAWMRAIRGTLLHGDRLFPLFLDVAWSDPAIGYELMRQVRLRWREATLFHPDEPDWPASISPATFHFLVAIAIQRPDNSPLSFSLERAQRRFVDTLDKGLQAAAERLAQRPETEQLIVIDAANRMPGERRTNVYNLVSQLPAARHGSHARPNPAKKGETGQDAQEPADEADGEEHERSEPQIARSASFVQRLKRQKL